MLDLDRDAGDSGVLILGDTNCKDEEAVEVCKKSSLREAPYAGVSWGSRNNKFHADCDYEGSGSDTIECSHLVACGQKLFWLETGRHSLRVTSFSCQTTTRLLGSSIVMMCSGTLGVLLLAWQELEEHKLSLCATCGVGKSSCPVWRG